MKKTKKYYYKCYKCGSVCFVEKEIVTSLMCVSPAPHRVSGICAGCFVKITKKEFDDAVNEIEMNKKAIRYNL